MGFPGGFEHLLGDLLQAVPISLPKSGLNIEILLFHLCFSLEILFYYFIIYYLQMIFNDKQYFRIILHITHYWTYYMCLLLDLSN